MTERGAFFAFSLPVLSMPIPEKERFLNGALLDAILRAGTANADSVNDDQVTKYMQIIPERGWHPRRDKTHGVLVRGAIITGVNLGHAEQTVSALETMQSYVRDHEAAYGPSPLVFVSSELFWDYIRDVISYRLISTLCAVNSIIGHKSGPVLIRREFIIARQLGYKTPAIMQGELPKRADQKPLSIQQVRDTLDKLESRGLFSRCQVSRRNVYFSSRMTHGELRQAVFERAQKHQRPLTERELDRQLFENHKRTTKEPQENHLKRNESKEAKKEPLKNEEPQENHKGTTGGTTGGTTKITAFKQEPFNKSFERDHKEEVGGVTAEEWAAKCKALRAALESA